MGSDHVGIGSDFDGIPRAITPLDSGADAYPKLVEALCAKLPYEVVVKVIGANFLRVLRKVELVSLRLRNDASFDQSMSSLKASGWTSDTGCPPYDWSVFDE